MIQFTHIKWTHSYHRASHFAESTLFDLNDKKKAELNELIDL